MTELLLAAGIGLALGIVTRLPLGLVNVAVVEAAQALRRAHVAEIDGIAGRIVPLQWAGAEVSPRLFDNNLISGVVDARSWTM